MILISIMMLADFSMMTMLMIMMMIIFIIMFFFILMTTMLKLAPVKYKEVETHILTFFSTSAIHKKHCFLPEVHIKK